MDENGILCLERYGTRKDLKPLVYMHDKLSGKMKVRDERNMSSSINQIVKEESRNELYCSIIIIFAWSLISMFSSTFVLQRIFLPQGYPESVSEDYFQYQIWDTMQAFCSSLTGALATQAVLKGSGVGDETANVASATITWLLRDGAGMVGRIAFAYYKGANLDRDAKKWRLFADILNDCATFATLLAPLFPKEHFVVITCMAGLAYSLVGVAGGCTRAALTMHQAKRDNMADVSAKDGSQETLVNLTALMINLILIPIVSGNALLTPGLGEILHPKEANAMEPVIGGYSDHWIKAGCALKDLGMDSVQFTRQVNFNPSLKVLSRYTEDGIYLAALRDTAQSSDVVEAYFEAETINSGKVLSAEQRACFINELEKHGWSITRHQLHVDEWRWSTDEMEKVK